MRRRFPRRNTGRRTFLRVLGLLGVLALPPGFLNGAAELAAVTGYQSLAGHLPPGWHRQVQRAARAWWVVKDYAARRWGSHAMAEKRGQRR